MRTLILLIALTTSVFAQDLTAEAWRRVSDLRCRIEHFYMTNGVYPLNQGELKQSLPLDPATGRPFVYLPGNGGYLLTVPEPQRYKEAEITLREQDWGYLAELEDLKRFTAVVQTMQAEMKRIAHQLESYKARHGHYPPTLAGSNPMELIYESDGRSFRLSPRGRGFYYDYAHGIVMEAHDR